MLVETLHQYSYNRPVSKQTGLRRGEIVAFTRIKQLVRLCFNLDFNNIQDESKAKFVSKVRLN